MIGRWLSLSQDIRGSTQADNRGEPASCFTARRGADVIGDRYPPSEGRMGQCGPAFSVANPHVCAGPFLGQLSGGNWMACGCLRRLRSRERSGLGVGLRLGPRSCNYPDHPRLRPMGVGCD